MSRQRRSQRDGWVDVATSVAGEACHCGQNTATSCQAQKLVVRTTQGPQAWCCGRCPSHITAGPGSRSARGQMTRGQRTAASKPHGAHFQRCQAFAGGLPGSAPTGTQTSAQKGLLAPVKLALLKLLINFLAPCKVHHLLRPASGGSNAGWVQGGASQQLQEHCTYESANSSAQWHDHG